MDQLDHLPQMHMDQLYALVLISDTNDWIVSTLFNFLSFIMYPVLLIINCMGMDKEKQKLLSTFFSHYFKKHLSVFFSSKKLYKIKRFGDSSNIPQYPRSC